MAQALHHAGQQEQFGFFGRRAPVSATSAAPAVTRARQSPPLCAGCQAREARYGFRQHDDDAAADRPRTLCFECFRAELGYRQAVAARLARGWNASQVPLPLEDTLTALTRRRRRAQIAARKALGL